MMLYPHATPICPRADRGKRITRGRSVSLKRTNIPVEGYEQVVHFEDPDSGLNAYISIHDTTLGPALGGMRMWPYPTETEALQDANRLARAMTYKAAIAQTGQGGGKAVILGDPTMKTEALLRSMGRAIDSLEGRYITAEDMNLTVADLEVVRQETRWVSGLSRDAGFSGNPSPMTALGCLAGLRACACEVFGNEDLTGLWIAIQGVGAVGGRLAGLCVEAGATVLVSDLNTSHARAIAKEHGATFIEDPDALLTMKCDILSPCARGAVLDAKRIPSLNCRIVAGAANNQLANDLCAELLAARGILYAPDYVINAGGIINIACEFAEGGYDEDEAKRRVGGIGDTLQNIFQRARDQDITTENAARELAEERLKEGRAAHGQG